MTQSLFTKSVQITKVNKDLTLWESETSLRNFIIKKKKKPISILEEQSNTLKMCDAIMDIWNEVHMKIILF